MACAWLLCGFPHNTKPSNHIFQTLIPQTIVPIKANFQGKTPCYQLHQVGLNCTFSYLQYIAYHMWLILSSFKLSLHNWIIFEFLFIKYFCRINLSLILQLLWSTLQKVRNKISSWNQWFVVITVLLYYIQPCN